MLEPIEDETKIDQPHYQKSYEIDLNPIEPSAEKVFVRLHEYEHESGHWFDVEFIQKGYGSEAKILATNIDVNGLQEALSQLLPDSI